MGMFLISQWFKGLTTLSVGMVLLTSCGGKTQLKMERVSVIYPAQEEERLGLVRYNPCCTSVQRREHCFDLELLMISESTLLERLSTGIPGLKTGLKTVNNLGDLITRDEKVERSVLLSVELNDKQRAEIIKVILKSKADQGHISQWERVALSLGEPKQEAFIDGEQITDITSETLPQDNMLGAIGSLLKRISTSPTPYSLVFLRLEGSIDAPNGHRLRRGQLIQEIGSPTYSYLQPS